MITQFYVGPFIIINAEKGDERWEKYAQRMLNFDPLGNKSTLETSIVGGNTVFYDIGLVMNNDILDDMIFGTDELEEIEEKSIEDYESKYADHVQVLAEVFGIDCFPDYGIISWGI